MAAGDHCGGHGIGRRVRHASFNNVDYGQYGANYAGGVANPCGDPPGGVGAALSPPGAEGGALRSQSVRRTDGPATLDGSVLRIDPATGAGVPGNPFYSSPDQPKFAVAVLARFSRERRRAALLRGSVPTDNHNACVVSYNAITRLRS